jgi:hypothetical protein
MCASPFQHTVDASLNVADVTDSAEVIITEDGPAADYRTISLSPAIPFQIAALLV